MLWAITSYFNPVGYRSRLANYRSFRANLPLPLVTVEAAADGRFELEPGDADILVQVPMRAVLWQKERLLNIALAHLPPDCLHVAWIDCDVLFEVEDWPERASRALAAHRLVHLYTERRSLGADGGVVAVARSVAPAIVAGRSETVDLDDVDAAMRRGRSVGFAWAARREVLHEGLYDACILGNGDRAILCAALGLPRHAARSALMTPRQVEHYSHWARRFFAAVAGDVGYVDGRIYHLWHGDLADRRYGERYRGFRRFGFDPYRDIAVDPEGCWSWTTSNGELQDYVRRYFEARYEDGR
jgi:hypothetical protein